MRLHNSGITPTGLSIRKGFAAWRTPELIEKDLYPFLFRTDASCAIPADVKVRKFDHHARYGRLRLDLLTPFIHRWFLPAAPVVEYGESLLRSSNLNPDKTIVVLYRGTDKSSEVYLARPEEYLAQAIRLLHENPDFRVLIQTDQEQVRDLFVRELGPRCFYFPELPVTSGTKVLHQLSQSELPLSRLQFAQSLIAVCQIVSTCRHLINHTGNMALWSVLYREHTRHMLQFETFGLLADDRGRIRTGDIPTLVWRYIQRRTSRLFSPKKRN